MESRTAAQATIEESLLLQPSTAQQPFVHNRNRLPEMLAMPPLTPSQPGAACVRARAEWYEWAGLELLVYATAIQAASGRSDNLIS